MDPKGCFFWKFGYSLRTFILFNKTEVGLEDPFFSTQRKHLFISNAKDICRRNALRMVCALGRVWLIETKTGGTICLHTIEVQNLTPVGNPASAETLRRVFTEVFNTQLMEKNHNRLHPASIAAQDGVAKTHSCTKRGGSCLPFFNSI